MSDEQPSNKKYRTYLSNFLPYKIADFFKYKSVVEAIKAIIAESGGGGGGGVIDGFIRLWQGAQFDKVSFAQPGTVAKLMEFIESETIADGTVFVTNVDFSSGGVQKLTMVIKDRNAVGGYRTQLIGANKETFALPMFETVEGQSNYPFDDLTEGSELTALTIETNPLNVAGDDAEAIIENGEIIMPPQPAGQRVYVTFKK